RCLSDWSSDVCSSDLEKVFMSITNRLRITLVWAGLIVLPLGSGLPIAASPAPQHAEQSTAKQKTVQFRITGMTCAACAKGLAAQIGRASCREREGIRS